MTSYLNQAVGDRIETSISLRPAGDVPFPMVVVNSGGPIDPMGFVRDTRNIVTENDVPRKGE